MKVLVSNAKSRISYNIIKELSKNGADVYSADFVATAMSFYSRYSKAHFLYPSPFSRQKEFVSFLIDKIKELEIDVFIPVFEELFLVSRHLEEFSEHVKLAVPNYAQVLIAHNKDRWEPAARNLDIAVPATLAAKDLADDLWLVDQLKFPALIKPKQGGGGWGIAQLDSPLELGRILRAGVHQDLPLERFIVQQKIVGEVVCVAMVFSHGQLRGKCAYRQIREYPAFGGQATCRISVSHRGAEENLQLLLEHLGWHGVCQADFIIEKGSGRPYLIDINPRFWGSLVQGIASGVDFPGMICRIAAEGDVPPVEGFRTGVKTRWLGGELRGFPAHFARADSRLAFLRDFFLSPMPTARFDDFSLTDPLPFFAWGWDALGRAVHFSAARPHDSLAGVWE